VEELREAPVRGHIFRKKRQSGDRWMAKWRDAGGQHQRVIGKAWTGRGRPPEGYLTKRGAQEVLDTILADARRGRLVARRPGATVTFADAAEELLRYLEHERGRRASTLRNYRLSLRNHILPALGQLPLTAVTVPRIDALRTYLIRRRGLAPSTVNQHLVLVHGILKRAQRAYGLPFNAASVVERQVVRRSGDFEVYSPEEVAALARAAASSQEGAMYVVAAYTGVRLGELLALRWRDIDYGKRLVHVRRSYVTGQEEMPKSGRVRSVPMTDQVMVMLDGLSQRGRYTAEQDLVFSNAVGEHLDGSALRRRFYAAMDRAALKRILRHTFGTLAVQAFPLTDVKAFMGHADISTTMIYVHHVPQHDAAEKLSAVLRATSSGDVVAREIDPAAPVAPR
jgi:integrase